MVWGVIQCCDKLVNQRHGAWLLVAVTLSIRCLLLFADTERNETLDNAEQSVKQPNSGLRNMPSNQTESLPYEFGLFSNFTERKSLVSLALPAFQAPVASYSELQ